MPAVRASERASSERERVGRAVAVAVTDAQLNNKSGRPDFTPLTNGYRHGWDTDDDPQDTQRTTGCGQAAKQQTNRGTERTSKVYVQLPNTTQDSASKLAEHQSATVRYPNKGTAPNLICLPRAQAALLRLGW